MGLLFHVAFQIKLLLVEVSAEVAEVVLSCENEKLGMTPAPLPSRILGDKTAGQWLVNVKSLGHSTAGCPASEGTVKANFSKECLAFPAFLMSSFP